MKLLGLDIGNVRIGVAKTDAEGIISIPLEVINRNKINSVDRIAVLVKKLEIEKIIVGITYNLDGQLSAQCKKNNKFVKKIKPKIADNIVIEYIDESYTSVDAEQILNDLNLKGSLKRRQVIDKIAAAVILEKYLLKIKEGQK